MCQASYENPRTRACNQQRKCFLHVSCSTLIVGEVLRLPTSEDEESSDESSDEEQEYAGRFTFGCLLCVFFHARWGFGVGGVILPTATFRLSELCKDRKA